ncbi:endonuclease/exonuclease/phosphatase family protein [Sphingomonas yabuuchiae]|uniref:Endonuclease/exonuclease/phosphatase family metal-dependent hydrolase n=1 Tax=Sphingomonas yabuuchiae TaxID=172044 RepID=A0AA40ZYY2_9SPHN|nr:endonuclease/exonuclease/phosphatase family protein [Sphingomonas yabuuchiae]MBB4608663.1 endonuclease/exonuclease/phosphatase family metal-dependent hydrolase [Sphingomonas yabuuchiae]MBN3558980.1 endonuclease/exonuclease/phosphatase family protein [Sphingomonas yabuuchiae]
MIKVASYNIRKGVGADRRRNPDRILDVLREVDADVIALQEADRRFGEREGVIPLHLLDDHSDWKPIVYGMKARSMGWHGNTILVRKSIQVVDFEAIHLPSLEPRGAVMADLRTKAGVIRVVGMHLDLSGLWRRRQAAAILAHLTSCAHRQPTVMMGDLNEWTRAAGCLKDFTRDFTVAETGPSFHAMRPIGRLDRIMVSPDLKIGACGVHATPMSRRASDHLPIWATIGPR